MQNYLAIPCLYSSSEVAICIYSQTSKCDNQLWIIGDLELTSYMIWKWKITVVTCARDLLDMYALTLKPDVISDKSPISMLQPSHIPGRKQNRYMVLYTDHDRFL